MVSETGVTIMVTGSCSSARFRDGFGLVAQREVGDVGDGAHRFVGPMHVHPGAGADLSGSPASTACISGVSAPSSLISAQANGRSSGWPSSGSGCQVHDATVPTLDTGTISPSGS